MKMIRNMLSGLIFAASSIVLTAGNARAETVRLDCRGEFFHWRIMIDNDTRTVAINNDKGARWVYPTQASSETITWNGGADLRGSGTWLFDRSNLRLTVTGGGTGWNGTINVNCREMPSTKNKI